MKAVLAFALTLLVAILIFAVGGGMSMNEAILRVVESQFDQIVRGIAAARGRAEAEVHALVDRGPFSGREAMEAKLVDGLLYRDQVYAHVKEKVGEGVTILPLLTYLARAGRPHMRLAKEAAGIPQEADVRLKVFPPKMEIVQFPKCHPTERRDAAVGGASDGF